jgi:hypothetical protein
MAAQRSHDIPMFRTRLVEEALSAGRRSLQTRPLWIGILDVDGRMADERQTRDPFEGSAYIHSSGESVRPCVGIFADESALKTSADSSGAWEGNVGRAGRSSGRRSDERKLRPRRQHA